MKIIITQTDIKKKLSLCCCRWLWYKNVSGTCLVPDWFKYQTVFWLDKFKWDNVFVCFYILVIENRWRTRIFLLYLFLKDQVSPLKMYFLYVFKYVADRFSASWYFFQNLKNIRYLSYKGKKLIACFILFPAYLVSIASRPFG